VAASAADGTMKLWDIRDKSVVQHYDAHKGATREIQFHPSGNFVISCGDDGATRLWDLREG